MYIIFVHRYSFVLTALFLRLRVRLFDVGVKACEKLSLNASSMLVIAVQRDWCLAQWLILSTSVVRTWGQIPHGQFLVAELNTQYPVKSFAPYLGGCRGWVPSDSLRKFLQAVNLYNLFKLFLIFFHSRPEA